MIQHKLYCYLTNKMAEYCICIQIIEGLLKYYGIDLQGGGYYSLDNNNILIYNLSPSGVCQYEFEH